MKTNIALTICVLLLAVLVILAIYLISIIPPSGWLIIGALCLAMLITWAVSTVMDRIR